MTALEAMSEAKRRETTRTAFNIDKVRINGGYVNAIVGRSVTLRTPETDCVIICPSIKDLRRVVGLLAPDMQMDVDLTDETLVFKKEHVQSRKWKRKNRLSYKAKAGKEGV